MDMNSESAPVRPKIKAIIRAPCKLRAHDVPRTRAPVYTKLTLFASVRAGNLHSIKEIYESSPLLFASVDCEGRTPLFMCAEYGHLACLQFIYSKFPKSISVVDMYGCTSLYVSALNGHLPCLEFIYSKCPELIDVSKNDCCTPFYASAYNGHLDCMKFIYSKRPQFIDIPNQNGCTPMYASAVGGHPKCMEFIYDKCPRSIATPSTQGFNPLYASVYSNHIECIKFIHKEFPQMLSDSKLLGICSDVQTFKYIDEANPDLINSFQPCDHESSSSRGLDIPSIRAYVEKKYPNLPKSKKCPCCRAPTKYYKQYGMTLTQCPICLEPSSTPWSGLCGHGVCGSCIDQLQ